MLNNSYFYHSLVKKYVIIMGTMLNDIVIEQTADDETRSLKVPVSYGPREKMMARVAQDPDLTRGYALSLPRISFEIKNIRYDAPRKLASTQKAALSQGDKNAYQKVFVPVPYNIEFDVDVIAKNAEDGTKIIEQIIPFFTPDWTVTAHILDDFPSYNTDISITLNGISQNDTYEGEFRENRTIVWNLTFTMKAFFFGPVSKAKIIKFIKIDLFSDTDATKPNDIITIYPGLTANGEPTSNSALTIPYTEISEYDNYGYIINIEETL